MTDGDALMELSKDIGKVAGRVSALEGKFDALEEYSHARNHDILNEIAASEARSHAGLIPIMEAVSSIQESFQAHVEMENSMLLKVGAWLVIVLGGSTVSLATYIVTKSPGLQ